MFIVINFQIETLGKNQTTFLTFKLLNSSNIEGLNVEGVEKELSSEEAQKKLTDSLTKSDVPVTVVNGKEKLVRLATKGTECIYLNSCWISVFGS